MKNDALLRRICEAAEEHYCATAGEMMCMARTICAAGGLDLASMTEDDLQIVVRCAAVAVVATRPG